METAPTRTIRHQVCDIPFLPVYVTEFQSEVKKCPNCSRIVSSPFPDEAKNTINFGSNIKALALYLYSEHFTPYAKIVQLIHDVYGIELSPATIEKFISSASNSLDLYENEVRKTLLESPILHVDETGLRVEGEKGWVILRAQAK